MLRGGRGGRRRLLSSDPPHLREAPRRMLRRYLPADSQGLQRRRPGRRQVLYLHLPVHWKMLQLGRGARCNAVAQLCARRDVRFLRSYHGAPGPVTTPPPAGCTKPERLGQAIRRREVGRRSRRRRGGRATRRAAVAAGVAAAMSASGAARASGCQALGNPERSSRRTNAGAFFARGPAFKVKTGHTPPLRTYGARAGRAKRVFTTRTRQKLRPFHRFCLFLGAAGVLRQRSGAFF